jgi:hypothetical protein
VSSPARQARMERFIIHLSFDIRIPSCNQPSGVGQPTETLAKTP